MPRSTIRLLVATLLLAVILAVLYYAPWEPEAGLYVCTMIDGQCT